MFLILRLYRKRIGNMRFNIRSLKVKITLVVLLLSLGSIWFVTYLTIAKLQGDFAEVLANQQFSSTSYAAAEVEQRILHRFEELALAASEITPKLFADSDRLTEFLASRSELKRLFGNGVLIISSDGIGIARHPADPAQLKSSLKDYEYFRDIMEAKKNAIGKARIGIVTKIPGVAFSVPINDATGKILGVLVGYTAISDPSLFGQIQLAVQGISGWTAVNDARYRLIVAISDANRALQPLPEPGINKMLDKFVAGYEGSGITINSQGIEVLTSAKNIPGTNWFVQAVLPTSEAFAPSRAMASRAYSMAFILSMLIGLIVWIFVQRILTPLATTSELVRGMTERNAGLQQLPVVRHDEVGELLNGFNTLFNQVNEGNAEQKRLNRALRLLSDCNLSLVRAQDQQQLLDDLCRLVVESGGYLMAWIGLAEFNAEKSVRPVAQSGYEEDYLKNVRISWSADQAIGRGPIGMAIRSGSTNSVYPPTRTSLKKAGSHIGG